jgi:hypothetical protein
MGHQLKEGAEGPLSLSQIEVTALHSDFGWNTAVD